AAGAVLDVTVAESPAWLRWRLTRLGVRPISNVVDVTNLLLLEYGQPLHAFDLDHVAGGHIIVRRAIAGEPFTTLDGTARTLDADDLVIADAQGPSALAGVMGGQQSEIGPSTKRVLLECAYFTPRGVRRTARRHGMHTESSHRFERGVDFAAVPAVLERAKSLIAELCGGSVVSGALHARAAETELPKITLRGARLDALLGVAVPFTEALAILERLGFPVLDAHSDQAVLRAVSYRPDVTREVDLIEEVARVRGLDAIPARLPAIAPQTPRSAGKLQRAVATVAVELGLSEAVTYAFVSRADLAAVFAPEPSIVLANPLGEERSVMRTSLLPGLCDALRRARRHGEARVRLFGIGSCFSSVVRETRAGARPRAEGDVMALPSEELRFSAILAGPRDEYLALKPAELDVYDTKGLALELVERVTGRHASVHFLGAMQDTRHLHPRGAAEIRVDGLRVGLFGPLHPDLVDALDLGGAAQVIELELDTLEKLPPNTPQFSASPRLPAATRDLSLVVRDDVLAGSVIELLASAGGALCESVELLGLFRGGSLPTGQKSLTFRIVCRDPQARSARADARTLTDKEVDELQARMLQTVQRELGAELRG
ncbi:MAG TPA: phenylalanine--tRNA ligase subunit beta, partial [Polyangiaceae bacterium]